MNSAVPISKNGCGTIDILILLEEPPALTYTVFKHMFPLGYPVFSRCVQSCIASPV